MPTSKKIGYRILAWTLYVLFEAAAFFGIYLISLQQARQIDNAHDDMLKGVVNPQTLLNIMLITWLITLVIILFNKFCVGVIIHHIVDLEKIGNKTHFQISFARKLSVALFMNAAVISYVIDIVIQNNIYDYGGFIYNESLIFMLNALFPPLVWLVDPWTIMKDRQRKKALQENDKALLTQ